MTGAHWKWASSAGICSHTSAWSQILWTSALWPRHWAICECQSGELLCPSSPCPSSNRHFNKSSTYSIPGRKDQKSTFGITAANFLTRPTRATSIRGIFHVPHSAPVASTTMVIAVNMATTAAALAKTSSPAASFRAWMHPGPRTGSTLW